MIQANILTDLTYMKHKLTLTKCDDGRLLHRYPAVILTRCKVALLLTSQTSPMNSVTTRRLGMSDGQRKDEAFYNKEQQDMPKISFLCVGVIFVE